MANNGSGQSNQLKHGAIGGIALVFLVIAAAAPLGASATNTPLIFMLGNGPAATFDFLIIGALLLLFSVGFTAMSTHITNAGAFYAYISVGLGKKFGTGAGFIAVAAYNLLSVYLVSAGGTFASSIIEQELGIAIPWWIVSLILAAIILVFSYFGIEGGTKFLMVCLVCEVAILAVVDLSVLIANGPGAYSLDVFSVDMLFNGGVPGGIGLGVCFAFLCFIGFEASAHLRRRNPQPRKIIPRATFAAVIIIAIVYSMSAWSITTAYDVMGMGVAEAAAADPTTMYRNVAVAYCGDVVGHIFNWLLLISNFASWMAAHGMASRYLYSFARADLLPKAMERTNKAKSPFIACCVNMVLGLGISFIMGRVRTRPLFPGGRHLLVHRHRGHHGHGTDRVHRHHRVHAQAQCRTRLRPQRVPNHHRAGARVRGHGYILYLVLSNFSLLTGFESFAVNLFIGGLMFIVGIIGYFVAVFKDRKGALVDPVSIDVEEEAASEA